MTQAQVAARVGVARETVRSWETGRTTPRGRKRDAYAKLLAELATEKNEQDEKEQKEQKDPKEVTAGQDPAPVTIDLRSDALTPAQAFDALYAFCAPALVRQTYLLTGRRELARESVERAFQLAWQSWPEVALDRDPAGWVRATAYECALSPGTASARATGTPNRPPPTPPTAR